MTTFLVIRRGGQRAQLHVAIRDHGRLQTACAKRWASEGTTVFRSRSPWDDDQANRCLECSRTVGAAPGPRRVHRIR